MLGKNRLKKVRKHVFLYSHEYRDQKIGEKRARKNFSSNTRIERAKKLRKKSSQKSAKTRFLYSHKYHDQKLWGKNVQNNFT